VTRSSRPSQRASASVTEVVPSTGTIGSASPWKAQIATLRNVQPARWSALRPSPQIGTIAAMRVLGQIAAAYALFTSTSLGIDGMSQSVSTPGPQRFAVRMEELKADRALYVKKIKKIVGTKLVVGTV